MKHYIKSLQRLIIRQRLRKIIADYMKEAEKDSGTRITAFAVFSNGSVDTHSHRYQKSEFVEVKE